MCYVRPRKADRFARTSTFIVRQSPLAAVPTHWMHPSYVQEEMIALRVSLALAPYSIAL
jgi:hypothetical protein